MKIAATRRGRNLLALLGSTVLSLLGLEVALRYRAHRINQESFEAAYSAPRPNRPGGRIALVDILRPSANQKIVYELRPNLDKLPFKDRPLSTNSMGFRCPEYAVEKKPGDIVVVGLGDSGMFGHGVGDGESYLSVLADLLGRKFPQRNWKVINSGVPGYNTVMELETLRTKLLQFKPDLVILDLVLNDLELPVYLRSTRDIYDLHSSFIVDFVSERLSTRSNAPKQTGAGDGLSPTPSVLEAMVDPERANLDGFSEQYRDMIGIGAFRRSLDELDALSREHGFKVLVMTLGEFADPVPILMHEARIRGFTMFSILEDMRAHVEAHYHMPLAVETFAQTDLAVSPGNAHPSVLMHQMAARKLVGVLEESGWITTLIEGTK